MRHVFTNSEIVEAFKNQPAYYDEEIRNSTRSIFSDRNVLYSYGKHFPLAVKREGNDNLLNGNEWVLANGDKHSVTTSSHQRLTFEVFCDEPRISFSALRAAGLDYQTVKMVDFWSDCYKSLYNDDAGRKLFSDADWNLFKEQMPIGATYYEEVREGITIRKTYHRIGAVLLQHPTAGVQYLCGMDERSYFIVQLRDTVSNIQEAFKSLKPQAVKDAEKLHLGILRQGEWFFIPRGTRSGNNDEPWKKLGLRIKDFRHSQALPRKDDRSNRHMPTRLVKYHDCLYPCFLIRYFCYGRVYHRQPDRNKRSGEHRILELRKGVIYEAVENTAINSWSAQGRVD